MSFFGRTDLQENEKPWRIHILRVNGSTFFDGYFYHLVVGFREVYEESESRFSGVASLK